MVYTKINGDKVEDLLKRFKDYCVVDFTDVFEGCYTYTEINLGPFAIDFREFVELETGCYITDSDWINTGVFTWEKLVEHLNKGMKKEEGILASFNVPEDNAKKNKFEESFAAFAVQVLAATDDKFIEGFCESEVQLKPYNPVKNISIEKYYRCSKGSPSQCGQFYSGNGILFMSESDCGKYYYWEDYNSKNELIFFRGEKSWVEDTYRKAGLCEKVIPVVKDGVTGEKKVLDLGKVTLIGKKETNPPSGNNSAWTDKHYDFTYTLTEEDIESGKIKIDPYFVNRMWRINSWDDTGAAFHSLKNYARICNGKNPLERDLKSLYKQVKRLCELHKVDL